MKRIKTLTAWEILPGMTIETPSGSWGLVLATCLGDCEIHLILSGDAHMTLGASEAVYQLKGF